jgi:hypothetical protein
MRPLYPKWANTALRLALGGGALMAVALPLGLMIYVRTPWNTDRLEPVDQPVEFDHRHHVQDDRIDCLYCHYDAEVSANAGVPATEVCMGCHSQVFSESPLLENVRRSYFSGRALPYNRVHDLADFVYFDHSVHVRNGVGCVECHGRVDAMPRVFKSADLTMSWCLDCHRRHEVTSLDGTRASPAPGDYDPLGGELFESSAFSVVTEPVPVTALTTCSACHR